MNFFRETKISFKIITLSTLLAGIFLGGSLLYVIKETRAELLRTSLDNLELKALQERDKINLLSNEVRNRVISLKGTPPFQGIIRAKKGGGFDIPGDSTYEQWTERLQAIFTAEIEATGLYDQLRYIDSEGYELVRVDFINNEAVAIPEDKLQYKGNRDYFLNSINLANEEVYISRSELNREGNPPTISVPHRPVIRYSTPVFDDTSGDFKGLIIANVLVDSLILKNELSNNADFQVYILGSDGFFILHPEKEKEWGGPKNLNTGFNFSSEFPGINLDLLKEETDSILTDYGFVSYAKVRPDKLDLSREWIIIELTQASVILGPINRVVLISLIIGSGIFVFLFFIFTFVVRHLLHPLEELVSGAQELGKGNFKNKIKIHSHDEIGLVAIAFNNMIERLDKLYSFLESQVAEKTKNLNLKIKELKKSQIAMVNVLEDIEEEKKTIENISKDLEKFKLAVDNTSDMIVITDKEGVVLYCNSAVERITGYKSEEAVGKKAATLWKIPMSKEFYEKMWHTIKVEKKPFSAQLKNKRKNGLVYYADVNIAPVLGKDREINFFVGIERDITKEKQIDQAKTEFVSLASHQLRTPLSSINWYAEMLLDGDAGKLNKEQKKYLEEIYIGNQRMVDLVNSLLNVSRLELGTFSIEPKETNLVELADSVIAEQVPQIKERDIKLETNFDKELPKVLVDQKLIRMVFQNLLSNAVKYTKEGGKVIMNMQKEKENLLFSVSDSGIGIPKSEQSRIFTKLFRAVNARESDTTGTGLGLYIVKSIIEQSGGSIEFESEEGKGTTFFVRIPLSGMKSKEGSKTLD